VAELGDAVDFRKSDRLSDLSTKFYYHDPRLQRFRGSLLFKEIAVRMDQKAHRPAEILPAELKYYVYSAHDTTMMALMENFGAYNGHLPEYASALLFELHEKQTGKFTVETWYVNETWPGNDPERLRVEDCDTDKEECTLEKFLTSANAHAPNDWYAECGIVTPSPGARSDQGLKIAAIVLGIAAGVFFLSFVATLVLYCRVKNG